MRKGRTSHRPWPAARVARHGRALLAGLVLAFMFSFAPSAAARADDRDLPGWLRLSENLDRPDEVARRGFELLEKRRSEWMEAGFGFVELEMRTEIEIAAGRRVRSRQILSRGFLDHAGVQQASNFEIPVSVSRSTLEIRAAYTVLPDGRRVPVDRRSVQITDPVQPYLFSDVKTVSIPMPSVVPGSVSVIEYETVRKIDDDPLPWGTFFNLQALVPILSIDIAVRGDMPAGWLAWSTDDAAMECAERGTGLRCRRESVGAIEIDPGIRSYYDIVPSLILAERQDWQDVAERVGDLVEAKVDRSPALDREVARIASAFETPESRVEEIYRVVSNEVRYLGMEHGDSAVIPHPASMTWDRRFGDCKDKVTLFISMARALGIEAWPVLTSLSQFELAKLRVPSSAYFDHMIVCTDAISRDGGCLDVTLQGSPAELPFALQGGVALDLGRRASARAARTLPKRSVLWDVVLERVVTVGCDGQVDETVVRSQTGPWGNAVRSALVELGPGERRQYFDSEFGQLFLNQRSAPRFEMKNLGETGTPWSVSYEQRGIRRVATDGPQHFYDVDAWLLFYARSILAENRHHPYDVPGTRLLSISEYRLCDEMKTSYLGSALRFEGPWGSLKRKYAYLENGVLVQTELGFEGRRASPEELADAALFLERGLDESAIQFGFERP